MNVKNNTNLKRTVSKRILFIAIVVATTLCMVSLNASASIDPVLVEKELRPGDCYIVTKTVTIPTIPTKVDVIFAFDLTVSMKNILDEAKANVTQIMNNLITSYPSVSFNFGVMSHMDYPGTYASCGYEAAYGRSFLGDYAYSLNQSLTDDITAVTDAINDLSIGGGADPPENYARIFYESYSDSNVGWRTDANRLLVNFGDSVPHDCNLNESIDPETWTTGSDPGRDEIMGTADDLDLHTVLAEMAANDTTLIECHSTSDNRDHWDYWTGLTGGSVYITNSTGFVEDVVNAITGEIIIPEVYNLQLVVTTEGFEDWLTDVDPQNYPEVESGASVTFIETICVPEDTTPGTYTFKVSAVDGDGFNYGDQTNEITVANAPPYAPNTPNPSDDQADVGINADLSWIGGDPDGDPVLYDVYFEAADSTPDVKVVDGQTDTTYDPGTMGYITTYYWYVVAWDNYGASNTSEIWSFSTAKAPSGDWRPSRKYDPIADSSAGSPYIGFAGESINFDGSDSRDPDGGSIVTWSWDFGDNTTGDGKTTTHIYSSNGTYHATLTVTDDEGATDSESFDVVISKANSPPENLDVSGPSSGNKNTDYTYTARATDSDIDDMLRYIFEWGDGTTTTSEVVASGELVTITHNWSSYGAYEVEVTVEDNLSAQTSTTFTVLIDVIVIDGDIEGYLVDEDSTDPFDIFDNSDTGDQTDVQKEEDGTYLIDSDNDGEWDHVYNPDMDVLLTYEDYIWEKYYKIAQEKLSTPGFELISLLVVIALVAIILRRRR